MSNSSRRVKVPPPSGFKRRGGKNKTELKLAITSKNSRKLIYTASSWIITRLGNGKCLRLASFYFVA